MIVLGLWPIGTGEFYSIIIHQGVPSKACAAVKCVAVQLNSTGNINLRVCGGTATFPAGAAAQSAVAQRHRSLTAHRLIAAATSKPRSIT